MTWEIPILDELVETESFCLIGSVCLTGDFGTTEMEMDMMRDVHMRGDGRVDCVDS